MPKNEGVPEDVKTAQFAVLEKALPKGFALQRGVTQKAYKLAVVVTGPPTVDHPAGTLETVLDLSRGRLPAEDTAPLLRKACLAWAKEAPLAEAVTA